MNLARSLFKTYLVLWTTKLTGLNIFPPHKGDWMREKAL